LLSRDGEALPDAAAAISSDSRQVLRLHAVKPGPETGNLLSIDKALIPPKHSPPIVLSALRVSVPPADVHLSAQRTGSVVIIEFYRAIRVSVLPV
jgi:hypothetical protein